jgi:hypothetical protein
MSLHFFFRPTEFSHPPFGRNNNVRPKNEESVYFLRFPLEKYLSTEKKIFHPKDYFSRKLVNGTVCRNLRIPSSLLELWRLQTPANTQNLVWKLIPTFAKLNLLSMDIICFHFHYFYLILFNFIKKSLHNIFR